MVSFSVLAAVLVVVAVLQVEFLAYHKLDMHHHPRFDMYMLRRPKNSIRVSS